MKAAGRAEGRRTPTLRLYRQRCILQLCLLQRDRLPTLQEQGGSRCTGVWGGGVREHSLAKPAIIRYCDKE